MRKLIVWLSLSVRFTESLARRDWLHDDVIYCPAIYTVMQLHTLIAPAVT